jgi:2-polyprenyl-3-methyl-5-hydroxy-6-metoxy-1,4-benzoquinol methylase
MSSNGISISDARIALRGAAHTPMVVRDHYLYRAGLFNVINDLEAFTGMSRTEVLHRLYRRDVHSQEIELAFWEPKSTAEITWFYRHSVTYLFINAIHPAHVMLGHLGPKDGPVLDFSGGAGNNVLHLAQRGVNCTYTGIGIYEYNFAEFRANMRNQRNLISFVKPFNSRGRFDSLASLEPPRMYNTILAFDVLEHIDHYERTVAAMVRALHPGGSIVEFSPFKRTQNASTDITHVTDGGVSMMEAMGPQMALAGGGWCSSGKCRRWQKKL